MTLCYRFHVSLISIKHGLMYLNLQNSIWSLLNSFGRIGQVSFLCSNNCNDKLQGGSKQVRFQPRFAKFLATTTGNCVNVIDIETNRLIYKLKVSSPVTTISVSSQLLINDFHVLVYNFHRLTKYFFIGTCWGCSFYLLGCKRKLYCLCKWR